MSESAGSPKQKAANTRTIGERSGEDTAESSANGGSDSGISEVPSIEKAILADVCLGVPLGCIRLPMAAFRDFEDLPPGPETLLFRGKHLALLRTLYREGECEIVEVVEQLKLSAEESLKVRPPSVTEKQIPAPSGDVCDYHSLAKYWWPGGDCGDELPYVNFDGKVNPATYDEDQYDYLRLVRLSENIVLLSFSAYLTDDARYARHAVDMLRTWFVDSETRQNPNFLYAQRIPGRDKCRWQGLIESRFLVYVIEGIRILAHMGALGDEDHQEIRDWFSRLLEWMNGSDQPGWARAARNNIGFWYDLQRMVYSEFCDDRTNLTEIVRESVVPRLEEGLGECGDLAAETARAKPYDYVAFSLAAMALISRAGEKEGIALWDQKVGDGRSFQVAHDWLRRASNSRELIGNLWSGQKESVAITRDIQPLIELGLQIRGVESLARRRGDDIEKLQRLITESEDRARLAEATSAQAPKQQELEKHKRRSEDLAAEKSRLEQAIADNRYELHARQRELEQEKKRSGELEAENSRLEQAIADERYELHARQRELEHEKKRSGELEAEKSSLEQAIADERYELHARARELEQEKKRAGDLESEKSRLEQESSDERLYLQAQVDAGNAMWVHYRDQAAAAQDYVKTLTSKNKDLRAERDRHKAHLDKVITERNDRLREMDDYVRKLENQVRALIRSRTWRAMAPVRGMGRTIRRLIMRRRVRRTRLPDPPSIVKEVRNWKSPSKKKRS